MADHLPSLTQSEILVQYSQLDRACRIGFLVLPFLFAFFALPTALAIGSFDLFFKDMLNGKELPTLTRLIISGQHIIICLILLLPALAIGTAVRVKRADHAIMGICLYSLTLLVISLVLWVGLMAPLLSIIQELTANTDMPMA